MALLTLLMPLISNIFSLIPNPAERAAQLQQLMTSLQQWDSAQSQTNTAEASNPSVFVAGWRPCIGWVCAFAVWYQYVLKPLLTWAFAALHLALPILPGLDDNMWQLTFGMLGMGGLRTFEKMKGVAAK